MLESKIPNAMESNGFSASLMTCRAAILVLDISLDFKKNKLLFYLSYGWLGFSSLILSDMSSHSPITTTLLAISFGLFRFGILLNLHRQQSLDISNWMSPRLLYPSTAKSEPTHDAISPPTSARSARTARLFTKLPKAENSQSPILFQFMPLLLLELLKSHLKQAQSNPPNLLCELLQETG